MKKIIKDFSCLVFSFCIISNVFSTQVNPNPKPLRLTGIIQKTSSIPDAEKSDYPDCYYSVLLQLGKDAAAKKEVVLFIKCFENKKNILNNRFQKGDVISAECINYDNAPEELKQIQQSDQLERFDLNFFFAIKISKTDKLIDPEKADILQKKEEKFIAPPPISENIKKEIDANIKAELHAVSSRLSARQSKQGMSIVLSEKAKNQLAKFQTTHDRNDLLFWEKDQVVCVYPNFNTLLGGEKNDAAVDVITAFDQELKKRNIRFIFVSFPLPWEPVLPLISTNIDPQISFDETRLKTVKALLEKNVEVIELGHYFYEKKCKFPYFSDILAHDSHPMDYLVDFLADLLKDRLKSYPFQDYEYPASCFTIETKDLQRKNLFPAGNSKFTGIPKVRCPVFRSPGNAAPVKSPVFVIGDSFSLTPWQTGGIRYFLGRKTRLVIDGYHVQSGSTRLMRTLSGRDYLPLSRKQVVFMLAISACFSPEYFSWEPLIKAKKQDSVCFDSSNLPEGWNSAVQIMEDSIILNTRKDVSGFVTAPLEIKVPGFKDKLNCDLTVQLSTPFTQIRILNQTMTPVLRSGILDATGTLDSVFLSVKYDMVFGEKFFIQFYTQREQKVRIRSVSYSFSENKAPAILHGPEIRSWGYDDFISKSKGNSAAGIDCFRGKNFFIESRNFLAVRPDSVISATGKIRNLSAGPTNVYFGLALYDKTGNILRPQSYPYKDNRQILTVISAEKGSKTLVLNTCPQLWREKCTLAKVGNEIYTPLADILGVIAEINTRADGSSVVTLEEPLKTELPNGTQVRINNHKGAYLYIVNEKLLPGERKTLQLKISRRGPCRQFSKEALPDGVCYVKPIFFVRSLESSEDAEIDLSDFGITF